MKETSGVTPAAVTTAEPRTPRQRDPRQRGQSPLEHAVRYAEQRHWDVFSGTWLEVVDGHPRCTCGDPACPAPGAHPAEPGWADRATGSATSARRMWSEQPHASVLMPTGRTFDALDVPETTGCLTLARMERMQLTLGPVLRTPAARMLFLVLPGASAKLPGLVRRLGWSPGALDLAAHGDGGWIAAPPTRLGTRGPVQWVRHPTAANRWLPDAEEVVPPLVYACGTDAAKPRER